MKIEPKLKKKIKERIENYIQEGEKLSEFERGANMALYRALNIFDNY